MVGFFFGDSPLGADALGEAECPGEIVDDGAPQHDIHDYGGGEHHAPAPVDPVDAGAADAIPSVPHVAPIDVPVIDDDAYAAPPSVDDNSFGADDSQDILVSPNSAISSFLDGHDPGSYQHLLDAIDDSSTPSLGASPNDSFQSVSADSNDSPVLVDGGVTPESKQDQ